MPRLKITGLVNIIFTGSIISANYVHNYQARIFCDRRYFGLHLVCCQNRVRALTWSLFLSELLELLMSKFSSLMVISKLEGDAVFAYAEERTFRRGDTLMEFIKSIYVTFRDRQLSMRRKTTCSCMACQNIPSLDLKFVVHHGDFIIQDIGKVRELVGSDVNLIHRLLKNHVSEATGWRAYIMFTGRCLAPLNFNLENAHVQMEEYEHLGEVRTSSIDLHARYKEIMDARRVLISPQEAHSIFEHDYNAPPEVLWDWFNDPHKRGQWMTSEIIPVLRVRGRSGIGARKIIFVYMVMVKSLWKMY